MTKNFVLITSFCFISLLQGCDRLTPTQKICKNNPEICEDLHTDGWCRTERAILVAKRFEVKAEGDNPHDKQMYDLLLNLEKYNKCIWRASGVQHINNPSRTNVRARAYAASAQSLEELRESIKGARTPYLSYYQWTHLGDDSGLDRLLYAEQQNKISDPHLLTALAGYYVKFRPQKGLALYLTALQRATPEEFNPEWLLGIATAFEALKQPEERYLFEKANLILTERKANTQWMTASLGGDRKLRARLDEDAKALVESIEQGEYAKSHWPAKFQYLSEELAPPTSKK